MSMTESWSLKRMKICESHMTVKNNKKLHMKLDKKDILRALEHITVPGEGQNMVESGALKNIMVFGDEVVIDITINNPSLQARKKTEVEILKIIHAEVYEKAKITVNVKVDAPSKPKVNEIKG